MDYDEPITKYWPEFVENGKGKITLADVLRHEAGLSDFKHTINLGDIIPCNIKNNVIGKKLVKEQQWFPSDKSRRSYHSLSRGFILNEVVRRVDPQGRTIGEIFRQDFQEFDLHCGLTDEELKSTCQQIAHSKSWLIWQTFLPWIFGSKVETNIFQMIFDGIPKGSQKVPLEGLDGRFPNLHKYFQYDAVRKGEIPSTNFNGSARGMARLASAMANKGKDLDGQIILSEDAWRKLHSDPTEAFDCGLGYHTVFTQGGINDYGACINAKSNKKIPIFKLREGYFGWQGFGGAVMQWHPELGIGFGYAPTLVSWYDKFNRKGAMLQKAAVDSANHFVKPSPSYPRSMSYFESDSEKSNTHVMNENYAGVDNKTGHGSFENSNEFSQEHGNDKDEVDDNVPADKTVKDSSQELSSKSEISDDEAEALMEKDDDRKENIGTDDKVLSEATEATQRPLKEKKPSVSFFTGCDVDSKPSSNAEEEELTFETPTNSLEDLSKRTIDHNSDNRIETSNGSHTSEDMQFVTPATSTEGLLWQVSEDVPTIAGHYGTPIKPFLSQPWAFEKKGLSSFFNLKAKTKPNKAEFMKKNCTKL